MTGIQHGGLDQTSYIWVDGHKLTVIEQRIRASHAVAEAWVFTDMAGHVHVRGGSDDDPYPTLVRADVSWSDCDHCDDRFGHYHLACRWCGEIIWPAETGPATEFLPGVRDYQIDGEPVTLLQAQAFVAQLREQDRGKWDRLYGWLRRNGLIPRMKKTRG